MPIVNLGFDTTTGKDLLKEGVLRKLFDTTAAEKQIYYKEIVNSRTTKDEWERDQQFGGLTESSALADGQGIPIQDPILGSYKQYTQERSGTGFRMTRMMDKFNKYDLWKKLSKSLSKTMYESKDIDVHRMFNSPTATTYTAGFDTLALAHDTHTGLLGGSTSDNFDNYLNAALSYSSLESVRYYFKTIKNDLGMLLGLTPTHLVFEPTLYTTAVELLRSTDKPHEMSNTTNALKEYLKPYEDPRLTSTTMWFVIAKNEDIYDINVITSQEPELIFMDAPDTTRDRIAIAEQMYDYGHGDARAYYCGKA
jgi:hypothetical protein